MKKTIVLILAIVLLLTAAVAGTVAWLQDSTNTITNTFTVGKVDINLTETENLDENGNFEVQLIPGTTYKKNPIVTVSADSEECYLYVKIEEINNPSAYLTYTHNKDGWTSLDGVANVFYRVVGKDDSVKSWDLLKDNQVVVNSDVDNADLAGMYNSDGTVNASKLPQLKYTAYAIQKANTGADAKAAWTTANFS